MQINKKVYLILATFLLVLPFVMAIENISILDMYYEYYGWVDFALYLLIFVGLIQEFMKLRAKGALGLGELGQGAKAVSIGLGVGLALALVTWEVKSGFYLFQLGGWIILILAILLVLLIINWLKSKDKLGWSLKKLLFTFIIIGIILYLFFPDLIYNYIPWSWANKLFNILIIIAIVLLLISLGKHGESTGPSGRSLPGRMWDGAKSATNWLGNRKRKTDAEYERWQQEINADLAKKAAERARKKAEKERQVRERKEIITKGKMREAELRRI